MSYIQFQQKCNDCGKVWNAAFGIVNNYQIAAPPEKCPYCGGKNFNKVADGCNPSLDKQQYVYKLPN